MKLSFGLSACALVFALLPDIVSARSIYMVDSAGKGQIVSYVDKDSVTMQPDGHRRAEVTMVMNGAKLAEVHNKRITSIVEYDCPHNRLAVVSAVAGVFDPGHSGLGATANKALVFRDVLPMTLHAAALALVCDTQSYTPSLGPLDPDVDVLAYADELYHQMSLDK